MSVRGMEDDAGRTAKTPPPRRGRNSRHIGVGSALQVALNVPPWSLPSLLVSRYSWDSRLIVVRLDPFVPRSLDLCNSARKNVTRVDGVILHCR